MVILFVALSASYLLNKLNSWWRCCLRHFKNLCDDDDDDECGTKKPYYSFAMRYCCNVHATTGLANTIAPMYLSEIAPVNYRGAFGTLHQLLVTGGIFLSSVFGLKEILGKRKIPLL